MEWEQWARPFQTSSAIIPELLSLRYSATTEQLLAPFGISAYFLSDDWRGDSAACVTVP